MHNKNLLKLSIKDMLTPKMLQYSLLPLILSLIILYSLFFLIAGVSLDQLGTLDINSVQTTVNNGVPHTETLSAQLEGSSIIQFLMQYSVTSWLASFLVYSVGAFLTLYLSIFVAVIVVGFLTPYVLKELQKRHYPDVEIVGYSNTISSLFLTMRYTFGMIMLFFLLIPLYFIPIVNIIAFNLPLYYFFHKMITFEVASSLCSKEEAKQIKYFQKNQLRLKTLGLYILSLIPFTVLITTIFFIVYLGNSYFVELKKLRDQS